MTEDCPGGVKMLGAAEECKTFFVSDSEISWINKVKRNEKLFKMEQTQFIYILLSIILKLLFM